MPEKSASAVQTAPSRPPVKTGHTENLAERINHMYDAISRRAYELFERNGRVDGHDVQNWLEAENQFLSPASIKLEEKKDAFTVKAEIPGFSASELEVNVEPRRVAITGKHEFKSQRKNNDDLLTEESSEEIFRILNLPSEVNTAKTVATLKEGTLTIELPKMESKTSAPAQSPTA